MSIMIRKLCRWFAAFLLGCTLLVSSAGAQNPGQKETERRPPALEFTLAIIATLLVLVLVCKPARKQ
jgi:hypothetical protein